MLSGTVAIIMIIAVVIGLLVQPTILVLIALVLGGIYWDNKDSPKETVSAFIEAITERDKGRTLSLVNRDSEEIVDMIFNVLVDNEGESPFESALGGISSIDCSIMNQKIETAICSLCIESSCEPIRLIRERDRWVIALNSNKEEGEEIGDDNEDVFEEED